MDMTTGQLTCEDHGAENCRSCTLGAAALDDKRKVQHEGIAADALLSGPDGADLECASQPIGVAA